MLGESDMESDFLFTAVQLRKGQDNWVRPVLVLLV